MLLGIDHLVLAVRDVAAAEGALARSIGLVCTGGGRHEAMGTYNRLAFLGDSYIELIGVFDRSLVVSSTAFAVGNAALAVLEAGAEGLATYALASDDVAADVATLRRSDSPIGSPVPGYRVRPDGGVVRWVTAFPELGPGRPPFLIEHEYAGAEWGDEARAVRGAFRHPGGGRVRLASLELPVADVAAAALEHAAVVGLELGLSFGGGVAQVGDHVVALRTAEPGSLPVVRLAGEAGTPALDGELLGVRWIREPRQ